MMSSGFFFINNDINGALCCYQRGGGAQSTELMQIFWGVLRPHHVFKYNLLFVFMKLNCCLKPDLYTGSPQSTFINTRLCWQRIMLLFSHVTLRSQSAPAV